MINYPEVMVVHKGWAPTAHVRGRGTDCLCPARACVGPASSCEVADDIQVACLLYWRLLVGG